MNIAIFYILAAVILFFATLCVTTRKILRAATYLLFVLIATAGFYFLMQVNFLGAVQLMVYAGGIAVLIVFAILLTSKIEHKFDKIELRKRIATALAVAAGGVVTIVTVLQFDWTSKTTAIAEKAEATAPVVKDFGRAFLSYNENGYVLPFEVITVLLLAAMIAAIMVAKKYTSAQDSTNKIEE